MSESQSQPAVSEVLVSHNHPLGRAYVARMSDGTFRAGNCEQTAQTFPDANEAFDNYRPMVDHGDHSAFNICSALEEYTG